MPVYSLSGARRIRRLVKARFFWDPLLLSVVQWACLGRRLFLALGPATFHFAGCVRLCPPPASRSAGSWAGRMGDCTRRIASPRRRTPERNLAPLRKSSQYFDRFVEVFGSWLVLTSGIVPLVAFFRRREAWSLLSATPRRG